MKSKNKFLLSYRKLNVLITGTTGFKGSWLAFWLKSLGANVIGISLKPEKESILFDTLKLNTKIKQYYLDITDFRKLNDVIKKEKPDLIFHLAAQSIVSKSFEDPLLTFNTNIIGSANVLESYRLNKIPNLVLITSDKCYLNLDKTLSFKEQDVLGGLDNYSSSKASAELIFCSYFYSYFKQNKKYLPIGTARAGNVIGGGDMKANRLVPDIIKSIKNNNKILIRNPNSTRPWQHVLEPLSGYLILGQKLINKNLKISTYPSWNFGPEKKNCKNVSQVVEKILADWPIRKKIIIKKDKMHESKFLSLNITKAKKELNWKPRLSFPQTISFTVDWYKNYFKQNNMRKITSDQINQYMEF